jgi:hypothetical protein
MPVIRGRLHLTLASTQHSTASKTGEAEFNSTRACLSLSRNSKCSACSLGFFASPVVRIFEL